MGAEQLAVEERALQQLGTNLRIIDLLLLVSSKKFSCKCGTVFGDRLPGEGNGCLEPLEQHAHVELGLTWLGRVVNSCHVTFLLSASQA